MSRTVIRQGFLAQAASSLGTMNLVSPPTSGQGGGTTQYSERLAKYIPSEVIALYVTLETILKSNVDSIGGAFGAVSWVLFAIVLVLAYFYLVRVEATKDMTQRIVILCAFIVWVFALGGPFELLQWYKPVYGALVLPLYSFAIPLIIK